MVIFVDVNFGGNTASQPPNVQRVAVQVPCSPAADNGLYIKDVSTSAAIGPVYAVVSTSIRL